MDEGLVLRLFALCDCDCALAFWCFDWGVASFVILLVIVRLIIIGAPVGLFDLHVFVCVLCFVIYCLF